MVENVLVRTCAVREISDSSESISTMQFPMKISIAKYPFCIDCFEWYVSLRHVDAATTFWSSAPLPNPVCKLSLHPAGASDYISTYD